MIIAPAEYAGIQRPYIHGTDIPPPGTLTAHERFCLVLLCSQPDTVRSSHCVRPDFIKYPQLSENVRLLQFILFWELCQQENEKLIKRRIYKSKNK